MKYNVKNLIVFGGSRLLADFVYYAKRSLAYELVVFSSRRHLDELIAGSKQTLRQILQKNRIIFYESTNINQNKNLKSLVRRTTLGLAFGAAVAVRARKSAFQVLGVVEGDGLLDGPQIQSPETQDARDEKEHQAGGQGWAGRQGGEDCTQDAHRSYFRSSS